MSVTLETGTYRWRFMGVNPVTEDLCHPGDVDELPLVIAKGLLESGHIEPAPGALVGDAPRGEPSLLIGINISEKDFLLREELMDRQEGTFAGALTSPALTEMNAAPEAPAAPAPPAKGKGK